MATCTAGLASVQATASAAKRLQLVGVVVGHPDVADLALGDQRLQRPGRLLGRGVQVGQWTW
jgi:hypothetical protein